MHQIFISYSSSDRVWAEELEARLIRNGLPAYRDKTRLSLASPFQKQLFTAIEQSSALVILWSERVRSMRGDWKEWVITEREHFRVSNPTMPIIYLLLDASAPDVDVESNKFDGIRGAETPRQVTESQWDTLIGKIKHVACPNTVEIDCYILAATEFEFNQLSADPNLASVINRLTLKFDEVARWYGATREEWKPAGLQDIGTILATLEPVLTDALTEDGVPEGYRGKQVQIHTGMTGLWEPLDTTVQKEINRIASTELCWFILDPFSLYHPVVQTVAQRIARCAERNRWLNLYLLDPIGFLLDRSELRNKLQNDFTALYQRLMRPRFHEQQKYFGGVDVWHVDDFERVFRETLQLYQTTHGTRETAKSQKRALVTFGAA